VQIETVSSAADAEHRLLHQLVEELRSAIELSLRHGLPHLAVTLDTARDLLETVIGEEDPKATRVAMARTRAEIALEAWRTNIERGIGRD
jgi:hypothetical protein